MNPATNSIVETKIVQYIAKQYHPLDYSPSLKALIKTAFPENNLEGVTKYELHGRLNSLIFDNYNGEQIFKYCLFKEYFSNQDVVGAFEIKVNNSRADFLTINGHSSCFEIKTALDNFSKFPKQASDYMKAFEYNYLIIDECHLEKAREILPEGFGLWIYKDGKRKKIKKALLNEAIDHETQLALLSKKELLNIFPGENADRFKILERYSKATINSRFKKALKKRYNERWQFLVNHHETIFPIDLQFFFNTNILPCNIYYH